MNKNNAINISLYRNADERSMERLRLTIYSFIIFGHTIYQSEAGFFDPNLSIFDQQQRDSASNNVFNSLLSPFRGNVDNNQRPDLNQLKDREPVNERPWWKSISTQSPIVQHIFKDLTTMKTTTSDYDAMAAKRFPEGVKLLENLKELNKIKEERERKAGFGGKEVRERNNGYGEREARNWKAGFGEREARERKNGYGEKDTSGWKNGYGEKETSEWKNSYGKKETSERKDSYGEREIGERKNGYSEKETSKDVYDGKETREQKDGYGTKDNAVPDPTGNSNETKSNDNNTNSKDGNTKSEDNNTQSKENKSKFKDNNTKSKDNASKSTEKPINQKESGEETSETDSATGVITKKQFFHQFEPIRPASERDLTYERMYYVN